MEREALHVVTAFSGTCAPDVVTPADCMYLYFRDVQIIRRYDYNFVLVFVIVLQNDTTK